MCSLSWLSTSSQALSVKVGGEDGLHIGEISDLSIADHLLQLDKFSLTDNEATIARPILKEIHDRLTFLITKANYLTFVSLGRDSI